MWRAHIHGDLTVAFQRGCDDATGGLNADFCFIGQAFVVHKAYETARTVTALFHFTAIGIEYAITEIRVWLCRSFHHQ